MELMEEKCYMQPTNRSFIGILRVSLRTDLDQCKKECLSTSASHCSFLIYVVEKSLCLLISGREDKTNEFNNQSIMYFRKTCQKQTILQTTLLKKACFQEFRGKILVGAVDKLYDKLSQSQCQKACALSFVESNMLCKAAIYYPKEQECIIASQNRFDLPELFIEDKAAIYMENRCVDGLPINETRSGDESEKTEFLSRTKDIKSHKTPKKQQDEFTKPILQQPLHAKMYEYRMDFKKDLRPAFSIHVEHSVPVQRPETIDSHGLIQSVGPPRNSYESKPVTDFQSAIDFHRQNYYGALQPNCFRKVQLKWIYFECLKKVKSLSECFALCRQCKLCLMRRRACNVIAHNWEYGNCGLSSSSHADFEAIFRRRLKASTTNYKKADC